LTVNQWPKQKKKFEVSLIPTSDQL
jgi:hypothetical protein